jgi:hypothetical protein
MSKIAIVDELVDISSFAKIYESLIFSPIVYSVTQVQMFYNKYKKYFKQPLKVNLPIIAMADDLKVIDEIVKFAINEGIELVVNNLYGLDYLSLGAVVWAGSNMNIVSDYSRNALINMNVKSCVSSIEKWCGSVSQTYKMCKGKRVLMTMAHCPTKTINKNNCDECKFAGDMRLSGEKSQYTIRRYRISKCYFELVDDVIENKESILQIDDLRGV